MTDIERRVGDRSYTRLLGQYRAHRTAAGSRARSPAPSGCWCSTAPLDGAGRAWLVDLARRTGAPLLVDDTLAELVPDGAAEPPLAAPGAPTRRWVLTVGSASTVFRGGLRVGWIRTSAPRVRRLEALRASMDLGGPVVEQLVVTAPLADVEARDHLLPPAR